LKVWHHWNQEIFLFGSKKVIAELGRLPSTLLVIGKPEIGTLVVMEVLKTINVFLWF